MENKKYNDEQIIKMQEDLDKIEIKKRETTFLKIIDKETDERTISKIVSFLLNPKNTSIEIIKKIIEQIRDEDERNKFLNLLHDGEFVKIECEKYIGKSTVLDQRSIVDILIEFSNFIMVIENKIYSHENNQQTRKYVEICELFGKEVIYVYLKPEYNNSIPENTKFFVLLYKDLCENIKDVMNNKEIDEKNKVFVEDFVKYMEEYLMEDKVVAISDEVKFVINNQEKINEIIKIHKHECEKLKKYLITEIKKAFRKTSEEYRVYARGWYIQIYKEAWPFSKDECDIHFEILGSFDRMLSDKCEIEFAVHNEGESKNKYSGIEDKTIKKEKFDFTEEKNIEENINKIVGNLLEIEKEYISKIEKELGNKIIT